MTQTQVTQQVTQPLVRPLANLFRLAFTVCILVITWIAFASTPVTGSEVLWDKANHFLAFAVLAFLLDYALKDAGWPRWCGLVLYGLGLELVQMTLKHRFFELQDLLADSMGILTYMLAAPLLGRLPLLNRFGDVSYTALVAGKPAEPTQ